MSALRNFYQKLGLKLYPPRHWLMLLALGSAVMSILLIFADTEISQRYLLPALVITLWFLFSVSLAYYGISANSAPKPQGYLPTLVWSLRKAWIHCLALLFLLVSLGLIYISIAAVRLALAH